jgi:triosephosphate isomerase
MRKPLISGNWKMNNNHFEAIQSVQKLAYLVGKDDFEQVDVSIHPPFTDIRSVQTVIDADKLDFSLGAQHCHWEDKGAFTGEVSAPLLADVGCTHVIVGHSERRQLFGDTDASIRRKVEAALRGGLVPIACVGETLAEREGDKTLEVVLGQLDAILRGLVGAERIVVAYEPVWAIGTGRVAKAEDAQDVHRAIRARASELAGAAVGDGLRILYGGSVKADNAAGLLAQPDIDGALVGGASLDAGQFLAIVRAA